MIVFTTCFLQITEWENAPSFNHHAMKTCGVVGVNSGYNQLLRHLISSHSTHFSIRNITDYTCSTERCMGLRNSTEMMEKRKISTPLENLTSVFQTLSNHFANWTVLRIKHTLFRIFRCGWVGRSQKVLGSFKMLLQRVISRECVSAEEYFHLRSINPRLPQHLSIATGGPTYRI
jgi:hypothetical protein